MKEKTVKDIELLLHNCGMVSRSKDYSHAMVRAQVAKCIFEMPKIYRVTLLNTLIFLLHEGKESK